MPKPDQIPAWKTEVGVQFHPLVKELLVINNFWEKENPFSQEYSPWYVDHTLVEAHTSKSIWGTPIRLGSFFFFKGKQFLVGKEEVLDLEELGKRGWIWSKHFV